MRAFRHVTLGAAALLVLLPALAQTAGYSGHGASTVSPEVLAKFAPAPLPSDLSRKIQTLMDLRAPGMGEVSPDGSRLFFGWSVTGSRQVWRLDGPDRFPVQLTGGEDTTSLAGLSPDGKTLFLQRDRKGEENPGLYTLAADGGPLVPIQHIKDVQTFFGFVSGDGKTLYFTSNDIKPDSYAVYRYDLATGKKEAVVTEPGLWGIADHRSDGTLLLQKATGSLTSEYSEYDPTTKKLTPVLGQGEKEEYSATYGAVPGQLLVLTPKFGEFRRLYRVEKGKFEPVTPELKWDVSGFTIDEARTRILYNVNEAGYTKLFALDAKTFAPVALPKLPAADHVVAGSTTPDGRYTTIGVETASAPRSSWVYDWTSGKLTQWVVPSTPETEYQGLLRGHPRVLPGPRRGADPHVRAPSQERARSPAPWWWSSTAGPRDRPRRASAPTPRCSWTRASSSWSPTSAAATATARPTSTPDNGPKRLNVITDIEDCAKYIRKAWASDGKAPKIGVMGGSYGGYATLMAMTMFGGTYDAGVSEVGISNLVTFLNNTAPYRRILRISEYGDPEKDRDALLKLSATSYVDRLQAPLLIIQGASDPRVPVGEAVQMYDAATKRGVPAGLIIFSDEGHGTQKRGNQVLAIGHTIEWMQRYLKVDGAK